MALSGKHVKSSNNFFVKVKGLRVFFLKRSVFLRGLAPLVLCEHALNVLDGAFKMITFSVTFSKIHILSNPSGHLKAGVTTLICSAFFFTLNVMIQINS